MKHFISLLTTSIFAFFIHHSLFAQPGTSATTPILKTSQYDEKFIGSTMILYRDNYNQSDIYDVPSFGITNKGDWFKTTVFNDTNRKDWVFEFKLANVDVVNFYIIRVDNKNDGFTDTISYDYENMQTGLDSFAHTCIHEELKKTFEYSNPELISKISKKILETTTGSVLDDICAISLDV